MRGDNIHPMTTTTDKIPQQIADIYAHVGGNRAIAMAFSTWCYSPQDVNATFTVAPGLRRSTRDRITHVRVTLESSDTYRVEFLRVTVSRDVVEVAVFGEVHADDLRTLIEGRTGLKLSLGTMGAQTARAS